MEICARIASAAGGSTRSPWGRAAPGARDRAGVVVKDAHDVGSREDDTELEGELCGVGVACELPFVSGHMSLPAQ